jgi:hypothetical protein
VTNDALAASYLKKVRSRLKVLDVLVADEAWSDVVREAQEAVELSLKAMLRWVGIEPPKVHDVGGHLLAHQQRFPPGIDATLPRLAEISARLRKEREFAFYGDVDFIPTDQYSRTDAEVARADAAFVAAQLYTLLGNPP